MEFLTGGNGSQNNVQILNETKTMYTESSFDKLSKNLIIENLFQISQVTKSVPDDEKSYSSLLRQITPELKSENSQASNMTIADLRRKAKKDLNFKW